MLSQGDQIFAQPFRRGKSLKTLLLSHCTDIMVGFKSLEVSKQLCLSKRWVDCLAKLGRRMSSSTSSLTVRP